MGRSPVYPVKGQPACHKKSPHGAAAAVAAATRLLLPAAAALRSRLLADAYGDRCFHYDLGVDLDNLWKESQDALKSMAAAPPPLSSTAGAVGRAAPTPPHVPRPPKPPESLHRRAKRTNLKQRVSMLGGTRSGGRSGGGGGGGGVGGGDGGGGGGSSGGGDGGACAAPRVSAIGPRFRSMFPVAEGGAVAGDNPMRDRARGSGEEETKEDGEGGTAKRTSADEHAQPEGWIKLIDSESGAPYLWNGDTSDTKWDDHEGEDGSGA